VGTAWLGARLLTAQGQRDALGAVATLEVAGRRLVRRAQSDGSYASSSDPRVLFRWPGDASLGAAARVQVRWVDGSVEDFDAQVGTYTTLRQGGGRRAAAAAEQGSSR
jgi:hypothetical protein